MDQQHISSQTNGATINNGNTLMTRHENDTGNSPKVYKKLNVCPSIGYGQTNC